MHQGTVAVVDPSTAPGGFDVDRLRSLVEARKGLLGPFLRRLIEVPLGLDRPAWVDDPHFDLNRQIRPVGVPAPGGPRELGALVGDLLAYKLEPGRPLWEVWFIEGLEDGRVALFTKMHHCLADGVRGAHLYEVLYDLEPGAPFDRPDTPALQGERIPAGWEMALRALPRLASTPLRAARTSGYLVLSARGVMEVHASPEWPAVTLPFQAPRTSLNRCITPHRGFAYCSVPLSGVKAIKNALSVTVNDVVLGICAGALRRYLGDRGELPSKPLIAQIPVAVHVDDGGDASGRAWGNSTAVMGAALPTQLEDPVERLAAIHASTHSAKAMQRALRRRPDSGPGRCPSSRISQRRSRRLQPPSSRRSSPADIQPDHLKRPGTAAPALYRRSAARGQLPDRPLARWRRTEYNCNELPRPHRHWLRRLPGDC